jgi:hypothetical protein
VKDLGKTLCVLLTQGSSPNCPTDTQGNVTAKGDFCSTTDSPGGCADSFWLAATFSASAAIINDGTGNPDCDGSKLTAVQDAGPDAPPEGGGEAGGSEAGGGDSGSDAKPD